MNKVIKNQLWEADEKIFSAMTAPKCQSEAEFLFFRNMRYKQEYEVALANDLIMSEYDNEDRIYIVRCEYDEYIVGHGYENERDEEAHFMNLSEALSANLCELGFLKESTTLLQWLKKRDYSGIMYNHNYAQM